MALVYVVVAILGASFGARAIVRPYVDGDLFWQKHLGAYVLANHALPSALGGETFSAPGAPWIPQEWLFSTLVAYLLDRNGLWVLALGAAAALSIAALVTVVRGRRIGASPLALCLCTALLAVDLDGSYGIRAQVYAWPFFAALLFVLDGEGAWCFLALPLVALWANLHASAAIAVPMIWIDAIVRLLQRGIRERGVRLRLALSAAAPFALLATPLGAKLPLYALALVRSPIRRFIDEWQPLRWDHHFFWYGALPMLVLVALCARTLARERPRDLVWVALLTAMSVEAVRNAALLGFVVLPLAARALDLLLDRFALWHVDPLRSAGPRRLALFGGAFLAVAIFVAQVRAGPPRDAWKPPLASFRLLAAMPDQQRVFCYDFAPCSVGLDFPVRVFMDGRADPYPPRVWYDFNTLRNAARGWRRLVEAYDINAMLVKKKDKLDRALRKSSNWRNVPTPDRCCRLYERKSP